MRRTPRNSHLIPIPPPQSYYYSAPPISTIASTSPNSTTQVEKSRSSTTLTTSISSPPATTTKSFSPPPTASTPAPANQASSNFLNYDIYLLVQSSPTGGSEAARFHIGSAEFYGRIVQFPGWEDHDLHRQHKGMLRDVHIYFPFCDFNSFKYLESNYYSRKSTKYWRAGEQWDGRVDVSEPEDGGFDVKE